ncbi:MAG TPA: sialidase family protein [Chthoniobacteraceae bacterium]|nr:sialidase family protein [Chthoniobacteraceae bacterium]
MKLPHVLLAALLCSGSTFADETSPVVVEQRLVVSGQGFFPVARQLRDQRLAVVLRGGASHVGIKGRLDIVFSADSGKSWTAPAVVVDSPLDDRNPAFGETKDGALVVAFWRAAKHTFGDYNLDDAAHAVSTWVTRSEDGGKTWSEASEIDVRELGYGSPFGKMLTLRDGTMLMNIYGHGLRPPGEQLPSKEDHSYLYRSEDGGKTWKRFATIGRGFNETGLLRLANGTLLAAMRSAGDKANVSTTRSTDGGQTWSKPESVSPPGAHPADLALLEDGRVLLVTGFRNTPFGVRAVAGDASGHFDWSRSFAVVTDSTNVDTGYPSSVVLTGGRVATFYYAVGSHSQSEWGVHCGVAEFQLGGVESPAR